MWLREVIMWDTEALKLTFYLLYASVSGNCPDVELLQPLHWEVSFGWSRSCGLGLRPFW